MPEMPDLEIYSSNLKQKFANTPITDVKVYRANKLNTGADELLHALKGESIEDIYREGKELWFLLTNKRVFSIHLMLKGHFDHVEDDNAIEFKTASIRFLNKGLLVISDPLNWLKIALDPKKPRVPDIFDESFTEEYLTKKLASYGAQAAKTFLIDPKMLRGIGNAYADEILWESRISPESHCNKIPPEKIKELHLHIRQVLLKALDVLRKTTPDVISGEYREFLSVHNPDRKTSPTGYEIKVVTIESKKTYYTEEQILYK